MHNSPISMFVVCLKLTVKRALLFNTYHNPFVFMWRKVFFEEESTHVFIGEGIVHLVPRAIRSCHLVYTVVNLVDMPHEDIAHSFNA